ncbi:Oidioi.mRNA.OKI2018_I69.chr1.g371.t2.cds [Oikopleura dioica]|nr:Oidioi.mRNA.OKI2018_I69.chr1.g371.t2.cds [Oikopleura dioica]
MASVIKLEQLERAADHIIEDIFSTDISSPIEAAISKLRHWFEKLWFETLDETPATVIKRVRRGAETMVSAIRPLAKARAAQLIVISNQLLSVDGAPESRQPIVMPEVNYIANDESENTLEATASAAAYTDDATKNLQVGSVKTFAWFFLALAIVVVITCFIGKISLVLETCCECVSNFFKMCQPTDAERALQMRHSQNRERREELRFQQQQLKAEAQRRLNERKQQIADARTEFNLNVLRAAQSQATQQVKLAGVDAAFGSPAVLRALEGLEADAESVPQRGSNFLSKINPFNQRQLYSSGKMQPAERPTSHEDSPPKYSSLQETPDVARMTIRTTASEPIVAAQPSRTTSQLNRYE